MLLLVVSSFHFKAIKGCFVNVIYDIVNLGSNQFWKTLYQHYLSASHVW